MEYSDVDRFNSTAVAFPLFREGDGRVVENLMWHDRRLAVAPRVFDYSYYSSHRRGRGLGLDLGFGLVTDVDVDSNAIASTVNPHLAHVQLRARPAQRGLAGDPHRREGVIDKAFQMLGLPDIDFESEEFNRTFVVQCADRRFASALIDPQMMDFLLSTGGEITFETKGRFLLLCTHRIDPVEMPALLNLADEFLRRVPPAVRELYETFPDGAGTDVSHPPTARSGARPRASVRAAGWDRADRTRRWSTMTSRGTRRRASTTTSTATWSSPWPRIPGTTDRCPLTRADPRAMPRDDRRGHRRRGPGRVRGGHHPGPPRPRGRRWSTRPPSPATSSAATG